MAVEVEVEVEIEIPYYCYLLLRIMYIMLSQWLKHFVKKAATGLMTADTWNETSGHME
jgi:hypothetical protein